ncbi:MAG: type II toxin-antitoxin system RelE/ParE family toxin [Rhodospirillaceae bacterium]|nr:type II toxin-antitoxin system RelE/ParE family toxin [Rhodospirillaceae bacterium]
MARFELAAEALADISTIADYTAAEWGAVQAQSYLDALEGRLTELAHRPLLGRRREELAAGLLCFPFESHVIFYACAGFGIVVVRILHKRQDPYRHLS